MDAAGTVHDGRPDCLPPGASQIPIRFATVAVSVGGQTLHPVVWVACPG